MATDHANARDALRQLVERNWIGFADAEWTSAADRWSELVFCIVNAVVGDDPERSRRAVARLDSLGLLTSATLEEAVSPETELNAVLRYVLLYTGFSQAEVQRTVTALGHIATVTNERFNGSIQRYLRQKAQEIRDELVEVYATADLAADELRVAVTHWLQNAVALPLSTEHQHVRAFCRERNVTINDLHELADELNLDPAVVDDLIRYDVTATGGERK